MSSRYNNPINEHTVRVLTNIREVMSKVASNVEEQQHALDVLEQAVEMNLWVQLKIMNDSRFLVEDSENLVLRVRNLQQEYLATVAICNFLRALN